jgi:hypothetical protein
MATTNHLGITLVEQSQSQKEVTVNQAFTRLDALLNTGAKSKNTNTPPGSPVTGDLYIVGASPTGVWSGQAGKLAYFDQIWRFILPNEGISLWVNDENLIYSYDGATWVASILGETNTASNLGSGNGVFSAKVGTDLRFKSLVAGSGVAISNTSNDITIASANDLAAVEALSSTGIVVRTATDTWTTRTITAGAGISIASGNGVSANPIISFVATLPEISGVGIISPVDGEVLAYQGGLWRNHKGIRTIFYNTQSGSAYTLVTADAGRTTYLTSASAVTLTLPNNLTVGYNCKIIQAAAGQVTFSPASGASLRNRQSHAKTAGQWAECTLQVVSNSGGTAAEYVLSGDTAA